MTTEQKMELPDGTYEVRAEVELPPELNVGEYANGMRVFFADQDVTIDFFKTYPLPGPSEMAAGATVVSRVVVPRALVGKLIRALNQDKKGA